MMNFRRLLIVFGIASAAALGFQSAYSQDAGFTLKSSAFNNNAYIPRVYTCNGANISPPLEILNVPEKTKSLALTVEDIDDIPQPCQHWLLWNMAPQAQKISENSKPSGAMVGRNSFNYVTYNGPCPVYATNTYHFTLYALDTMLNLPGDNVRRADLDKAMKGHIIQQTVLKGRYYQTPYAQYPAPVSK